MAIKLANTSPYDAIVDRLKYEARNFADEFMYWVQHLSDAEKLIGMCLFALVLLLLMANNSRSDRDPGSSGRQFSGALFLVVTFAFAAGWMLDSTNGHVAQMFGL